EPSVQSTRAGIHIGQNRIEPSIADRSIAESSATGAPMEAAAFARAQSFLNYSPIAKWSAIASGVATVVFYVVLLVVLALFADLMVNRGEIPCFDSLPKREWHAYVEDSLPLPSDATDRTNRISDIRNRLGEIGVSDESLMQLATGQKNSMTPYDAELRRS